MKVCQDIGCPHPNQLEHFGIGLSELNDWWAFYLWEGGSDEDDNKPSDADRMQALKDMKARWGG